MPPKLFNLARPSGQTIKSIAMASIRLVADLGVAACQKSSPELIALQERMRENARRGVAFENSVLRFLDVCGKRKERLEKTIKRKSGKEKEITTIPDIHNRNVGDGNEIREI